MGRAACSPIATASQSRGSSPCCLLQSRETEDSGLGRGSLFFPLVLWILAFPVCFCHGCSSRNSGGLCYSLQDYHRNCRHPHEEGRKCTFMILHFICVFFPIFSLVYSLKLYPFFTSFTPCVWICTDLSALWTAHEIYLLPPCTSPWHLLCCNCFHSCVHVIPNTLLFPLQDF